MGNVSWPIKGELFGEIQIINDDGSIIVTVNRQSTSICIYYFDEIVIRLKKMHLQIVPFFIPSYKDFFYNTIKHIATDSFNNSVTLYIVDGVNV